jgi:hypothetical protein
MSGENTTDLPIGKSPDLPPEPVNVTTSVTADAKGSKAPDLSKTTPKVTPSAPIDAEIHKELRIEPRIRVRWYADALIDGQGVYQGFVKDISLNGTDIFIDLNLQKVKFVKLRIYVPPLSKASTPHVMEVSAKVIYTAYDGNESLFHTGVNFTQFNLASDQAYLQSRIAFYSRAR